MKRVLIIAPHADDEIIGVGGTLIKHVLMGDEVYVCIVTRGVPPIFSDEFMEKLRRETLECHKFSGVKKVMFLEFPSVMLDGVPRYELNASILKVFSEVSPQIVYIPHFGDMQKDHALVAEAAMVAVRPKYKYKIEAVYGYETLSETEWNAPHPSNVFIPQRYVDISESFDKKTKLLEFYKSQLGVFPDPRSIRAVKALAEYRGATIGTEYAEAFSVIREID